MQEDGLVGSMSCVTLMKTPRLFPIMVSFLGLSLVACTNHAPGLVGPPTSTPPPQASQGQSTSPPLNLGEGEFPVPAPSGTVQNPWARSAREVLLQPCGRCHRSNLPTAIRGALAVFDLTRDPWYDKMSARQIAGLLSRVRGNRDIPEWDKQVIESFVRCTQNKDCSTADN